MTLFTRFRTAFRSHPFLTAAFVAAVAVAVVFAARTAIYAVYWSDPAHRIQTQTIEGWMTPRYVAHNRRLSRDQIIAALGDAMPPPGHRLTLSQIAERSGVPLDVLIARIEAAAAARLPE